MITQTASSAEYAVKERAVDTDPARTYPAGALVRKE